MKALDTNVLVRFLVRDDERQAETIYRIFKQAESVKGVFFVPLLVVLETVWVLESVYKIPRQEILDSINELILMPILEFETQSAILNFVSSARETKMDLSDLLIAHPAKFSGCECVLTFGAIGDKKKAAETYSKLPVDPHPVCYEFKEELRRRFVDFEEPLHDEEWLGEGAIQCYFQKAA
jgi:predicted nucleic-acid-binding protein